MHANTKNINLLVFEKKKNYLLNSNAQEQSDNKNQNCRTWVYHNAKPRNGVAGQVRRQVILTSKK